MEAVCAGRNLSPSQAPWWMSLPRGIADEGRELSAWVGRTYIHVNTF